MSSFPRHSHPHCINELFSTFYYTGVCRELGAVACVDRWVSRMCQISKISRAITIPHPTLKRPYSWLTPLCLPSLQAMTSPTPSGPLRPSVWTSTVLVPCLLNDRTDALLVSTPPFPPPPPPPSSVVSLLLFLAISFSSHCIAACTSGTYWTLIDDSGVCVPCPASTYSSANTTGVTGCHRCPAFSKGPEGSGDVENCECNAGYWMNDKSQCEGNNY